MPHVVNLGEVKDLIRSWDEVRTAITKGRVTAFALTLQAASGREFIFHGGVYKRDYAAGLMAGLKQSWVMTQSSRSKNP